jgi:hypothetical protein
MLDTPYTERPFLIETLRTRRFLAFDRATGHEYALVRDRNGLRIYQDGKAVRVPENVPATATDYYVYAVGVARLQLAAFDLMCPEVAA